MRQAAGGEVKAASPWQQKLRLTGKSCCCGSGEEEEEAALTCAGRAPGLAGGVVVGEAAADNPPRPEGGAGLGLQLGEAVLAPPAALRLRHCEQEKLRLAAAPPQKEEEEEDGRQEAEY